MFYTNLQRLCQMVGETPYTVAEAIGIKSTNSIAGWRNGAVPRPKVVGELVKYFNERGLAVQVADFFVDDGSLEAAIETNRKVRVQEDLFSNPKMRLLFDAASGATDADLLEAAALLERRKEERNK